MELNTIYVYICIYIYIHIYVCNTKQGVTGTYIHKINIYIKHRSSMNKNNINGIIQLSIALD